MFGAIKIKLMAIKMELTVHLMVLLATTIEFKVMLT
jgi:hypothetical protein